MSDEIVLVVNGKRYTVQVAADTTLLYVLQNELGLTGLQYGCDEFVSTIEPHFLRICHQ
jgi:aerobic-type carbon monoxide dehydrogenase small subunit (CoxS/CutS family)